MDQNLSKNMFDSEDSIILKNQSLDPVRPKTIEQGRNLRPQKSANF